VYQTTKARRFDPASLFSIEPGLHPAKVEAAGIEPPRENTGKTALPAESGAKSGTLGAHFGPAPTDLRTVIDAWPTLPEAIRADIVAMVRTAGGDTAEDWPPVPTSGGCAPQEYGKRD